MNTNPFKLICIHFLRFIAFAVVFCILQMLFPPVVSIIFGLAGVFYFYFRFLKTSSKIINGIFEAGRNKAKTNFKSPHANSQNLHTPINLSYEDFSSLYKVIKSL
ncbi:MAG TPA: hypothetical protein VF941_17435 [Clostridia bacterium]